MRAIDPVSDEDFAESLTFLPDIKCEAAVAVAVSGGPDSMALTALLSAWARKNNGPEIHALSVDHGLREGAGAEAESVGLWVNDVLNETHRILKWEKEKPETRIMEAARQARYDLMAGYCLEKRIGYLFLAHHQDDQAETVLIRLAKGSGLDGLGGMRVVQKYSDSLVLLRPLLNFPKERLIETCKAMHLPFIEDPSNEHLKYTRPRLRQAREVLEAEGLSAKRLAVTAKRLDRARCALDAVTDKVFDEALKEKTEECFSFDPAVLRSWPEEIGLRVILRAMQDLRGETDYGPRLEKVEELFHRIYAGEKLKRVSLGQCLFAFDKEFDSLLISREHGGSS